jgi:hypothetical protein
MKQYNKEVQLPTDSNYVLRCLEATITASNNTGAPMVVNKWEITAPASVEIAGEEYSIAGTQITSRHVLKSIDKATGEVNEQKTATCTRFVFESGDKDKPSFYEALGYDPKTIDRNNPPLDYVGKSVYAQLSAKADPKRKTPTKVQVDKGEPGDIMCHPVTKKPLNNYYPQIDQIFCLVPAGGAFGG